MKAKQYTENREADKSRIMQDKKERGSAANYCTTIKHFTATLRIKIQGSLYILITPNNEEDTDRVLCSTSYIGTTIYNHDLRQLSQDIDFYYRNSPGDNISAQDKVEDTWVDIWDVSIEITCI